MATRSIPEQKLAQRKEGIQARKALTPQARRTANAAICGHLLALEGFQQAHTLLAYAAFGGEVDLSALLTQAEQQGKTVAYPICLDDRTMVAAVPQGDAAWERGSFGIWTPILSRSQVLPPEELDLILVPCAAFDSRCNRVGMGKGYYDRYLPQCVGALRVGIAFEAQRVDQVAVDQYDQHLDNYVTERAIYTWNH